MFLHIFFFPLQQQLQTKSNLKNFPCLVRKLHNHENFNPEHLQPVQLEPLQTTLEQITKESAPESSTETGKTLKNQPIRMT